MGAQQIASQLFKKQGFGVGRIRAFGAELVRPDDVYYELRAAEGDGDLLRLQLAVNPMAGNEQPPIAWLVIEKPGQLQLADDTIRITGGDYLRFEERTFTRQKGGQVRALELGRDERSFDPGAAPVLELVKHRDA